MKFCNKCKIQYNGEHICETEKPELPVDNSVRYFTLIEIQNAIRGEITREYYPLFDEEELQNKIYETIGLVTAALNRTVHKIGPQKV